MTLHAASGIATSRRQPLLVPVPVPSLGGGPCPFSPRFSCVSDPRSEACRMDIHGRYGHSLLALTVLPQTGSSRRVLLSYASVRRRCRSPSEVVADDWAKGYTSWDPNRRGGGSRAPAPLARLGVRMRTRSPGRWCRRDLTAGPPRMRALCQHGSGELLKLGRPGADGLTGLAVVGRGKPRRAGSWRARERSDPSQAAVIARCSTTANPFLSARPMNDTGGGNRRASCPASGESDCRRSHGGSNRVSNGF